MSAPSYQFGRLSLEAMTPTTSSRPLAGRGSTTDFSSDQEDCDSDTSDSDSEATSSTIRSPSKLIYKIDHLPEAAQSRIRDVFRDPPQLALQRCRRVNNTYAFQMTELVTRSVRIRAPAATGDGARALSCSCECGEEPCAHLLWLLDKIAEQTLYGQRGVPLRMTPAGYPEEMDDPFRAVAEHDLDVLGPGLHCPVVGTHSSGVDSHRLREARQLLATVQAVSVESFRPDIFEENDTSQIGSRILERGDMDATLTRMLLEDHHFFNSFLSTVSSSDATLRDPFRKLSQRVDRVLAALDRATKPLAMPPPPMSPVSPFHFEQQPPRDVQWAAKHILGCTSLMRSFMFARSRPWAPSEALSAARALIHILKCVVSRNVDTPHPSSTLSPASALAKNARTSRNLYLYLIGDQDRDFVIGVLSLVPTAARQFIDTLEDVLDEIGTHGAPAAYVDRFRKLLERLRTSSAGGGAGIKRTGYAAGQDAAERGHKRMK